MDADSIAKIAGSIALLVTAMGSVAKLLLGDSIAKRRLKTDLDVLKLLKDLGLHSQTVQQNVESRTRNMYSDETMGAPYIAKPAKLIASVVLGIGMLCLAYYIARGGSYFWAAVLGFYSMSPFLLATDFMGRIREPHRQRDSAEHGTEEQYNNRFE